jgi:hypothetical protein
MKIYILSSGFIECNNDLPEAAFKTKKAMLKYIKENYPNAKGLNRMEKNENYWEDDTMWLYSSKIELL